MKQAYKICYYISKLYNYEILRMKCEFVKDFHGSIWFQYASNVWVRPSMSSMRESEDRAERVQKINLHYKNSLQNQIEKYKADTD